MTGGLWLISLPRSGSFSDVQPGYCLRTAFWFLLIPWRYQQKRTSDSCQRSNSMLQRSIIETAYISGATDSQNPNTFSRSRLHEWGLTVSNNIHRFPFDPFEVRPSVAIDLMFVGMEWYPGPNYMSIYNCAQSA